MLHFAVAGVPRSTGGTGGTVAGIERAVRLGITAMELEWVRNIPKSRLVLSEIRTAAQKHNVYLTVHASYYINLNAKEKHKLEASKKRVVDAMEMGELAGAHSVCVHPAFYLGMDSDVVYDNVRRATDDILKRASKKNLEINLAFETMGKPVQFGTLEEVLKLSKEFGIYPCVDPAHMHARTNGEWNTESEWNHMFDLYSEYLGEKSLDTVHMHYSGIQYTVKGERRHLPLKESDAKWEDFISVLKRRGIGGTVVCESPLQEADTLLMQQTYDQIK